MLFDSIKWGRYIISGDSVAQARRYDGWASSNKMSASFYESNSQLREHDLTPAINALAGFVIGQLAPGGVFSGVITSIIGYNLKNDEYERAKNQALREGKGILYRIRYNFTKNYYGQLVPSGVETYYSVM